MPRRLCLRPSTDALWRLGRPCGRSGGCVVYALKSVASHYDVLGVSKSSTPEQIRRAYYQQARAWHPDRFVGKAAAEAAKAEEAMREVNEAFRVLGDKQRRSAYDNSLVPGAATSGRITVDDGVTRIDPRLLDPEYLVARRRQREDSITAHHSRMMNVIPWLGFMALLVGIFVFTAYATRTEDVAPIEFPGPEIGVSANACVRLIQGGALTEVPCNRVNDGQVIGARFPDGVCPPFTNREISISEDRIVCLR